MKVLIDGQVRDSASVTESTAEFDRRETLTTFEYLTDPAVRAEADAFGFTHAEVVRRDYVLYRRERAEAVTVEAAR